MKRILALWAAIFVRIVAAKNVQWTLPLPADIVALNSTMGVELMKSPETHSVPFWNGFMHLETQKTQTFCSIATSVTILNALASGTAPVDPRYDPYPYWTQDSFFNECTSMAVTYRAIHVMGATLDQLGQMLSCYDVKLHVYKANQTDVNEFRKIVKQSMERGDHIAINFKRSAIGESGNGHFSPIMAYNAPRDMVLLTDVARYKYPSAWVPVVELFDAMMTIDLVARDYRGFVLVSPVSGSQEIITGY